MEEIKDYRRKQRDLWLFFRCLPEQPIGTDKDGQPYDKPHYQFRNDYRKEFEGVAASAADLFLSCIINEIDLESWLLLNTDKIQKVRMFLSDSMKYPVLDVSKNQWLKSLLDAGIISDFEYMCTCNEIGYCADTMKNNVTTMKALLRKYGGKNNLPNTQVAKSGKGNRNGTLIDIFKDVSQFDSVVAEARSISDEGELVRYFYELIQKGVLNDFPTKGMLCDKGINVKDNYTKKLSYWRKKQ